MEPRTVLEIMSKSENTLTLRVDRARNSIPANKQFFKDTGIVEASVLTREDRRVMNINDKKQDYNQKDEYVPDVSVYNRGHDPGTYPVNNSLYCSGGNVRGVDRLERDCLNAPAKYSQHNDNSYPGVTYNIVRRHLEKPYHIFKKIQYVHLYLGNDCNKTRLQFTKVNNTRFNKGNNTKFNKANNTKFNKGNNTKFNKGNNTKFNKGNSANKFISVPTAIQTCWAKLNVCYESGNDEKYRTKLGISTEKDHTYLPCNNRNNSRYVNDSGSDADNDNEGTRSNVDGSEWEDAQSGASEGSESEKSHSGDETRRANAVIPEECYGKCDSKSEDSNETGDKNMAAHSENDFLSDGNSEEGSDTECSVDFENISGSVFWSEDVSDYNHIVDDDDDNKDTTFCENTVNEEINDFFLRNCAGASAGDGRKQHSPRSIGLSTGQSATRKGQNAPFLDNDQGILGSSSFRGTIFPSLIRGKPSMPLKIMSLTSNPFDNYKRMIDALKARLFSNINEIDQENCSDGKDRGCARRSVSIINNESMTDKSRVLHVSSSDSDICKVDNNEKSTSSSAKEVDETYRALPAWCDWEAEFDCDYREVRSHKDRTVSKGLELTNNISREKLDKGDASKKRDQDKERKEAKSKHFSSCKREKSSGASSAFQEKKASNINKSTTKGPAKKKQINFKFQGPAKQIRYEHMDNTLSAVQADNTAPSEKDRKDGRHQTSTISSISGKPASMLPQGSKPVIIQRDSEDIDSFEDSKDLQETETVSKDCQKELSNRKDILKNNYRERINRKITSVTKESKPSEDSEMPVAALAVFKASPETEITTTEGFSDRAKKEYSLSGAHSYSMDTEHTQKENIHRLDKGTEERLMSPEFDNNALDVTGRSTEILRANEDMQSEKTQKDHGRRVRSLISKIASVTPKKNQLGPNVVIHPFKDVTHTRLQEYTPVKSNQEWAKTTTPNMFKVVSNRSPRTQSSPQIEIIRPRYSILASKARKRRPDNQKSRKSKDGIHKKWLGKTNVQVTKPNKSSPLQTTVKKSRSENSLTAVPGKNIKDVRPVPALPSSGEHRCYLEVENRHKLSSIDRINGTSVDAEQASTRIGLYKRKNEDFKVVADDPGVKMFKSVRKDYDHYYFQNMPSATSPDIDKNISTSSPERSIPDRKEKYPSSEIYFITIPKRHASGTDNSARSPQNSHSLSDVYFSRNPNKYELLEESIFSEEEYAYSHVDVTTVEDVDCTLLSMNSSSDMKCRSSSPDEDISTKDIVFYDDCLLDLVNKRAVTYTANQETLTKIIFSNETGSEVMNSLPDLKQTLTIRDLLAESLYPPSDKINPVEPILPEVNVIAEFENAYRDKRQRKRRRNKRKHEQDVIIPPNGEQCMGDNEKMGNAQSDCDKTPRCQEIAGGNMAQSILMAAAEDTTFETKLMNYENPNFRKFHKSDTDFRSAVTSSNVKSNSLRETDHSPNAVEHPVTRESKQFIDNEPDSNLYPDNNDELLSQYSCDSEESDDDEYDCDPKLQHKLALLLQRIEDTNCIKIVSTQEFYKKKHGTASFLNDLAKMIDRNLEKCNKSEQENANNEHNVVVNELLASSCPNKVSKKEEAYPKLEKQGAKKAQDCAGGGNHTEEKHCQFDENTEGGESKSLQTMGCLARHVRKQISDMHRLTENDGNALLEPDNILCAHTKEHRSSHGNKKERKATGKRIHKGSTRNESKQPREYDNTETVNRLRKLEVKRKKNTCNDSLLDSATEGEKARRNDQYNTSRVLEYSNMKSGKMQRKLYNASMYSDCSEGSIKTEIEYNQGECKEEDRRRKVNNDDDYYDSDSNNLGPVSSNSSAPVFRVTDVHKGQPPLNGDFLSGEFHGSKDAVGSNNSQDQASESRNVHALRGPCHSEVVGHRESMSEYTCTHLRLTENEILHETVTNKGGDLISAERNKGAFENTSCDACYWQDGVTGDAKEDAKCLAPDKSKLDDGYEKYKQHHAFNYASNHRKQKVLKTTGTQYDPAETRAEESCTMAGVLGSLSDIYYHIQEKLSTCGSDQNLSVDSSLCQSHTEGSHLSDIAIPQELSCTKGQAVSTALPKLDFTKPKKNVTFQDDETREAIRKNTSDKQTDSSHNDGSISNNRRTVEPQDSRVHNNEVSSRMSSKNSTVINSGQQTHHMRRCIKKTPEHSDGSSLHSCEYDDREISRPGFVSYIHKHRRRKSEREAAKELMSVSSTDTLSYQQSKNNRATVDNSKGTITHEPSRKDDQLSRIGVTRKESLTEKSVLQNHNPNVPEKNTTSVCCRHNTDQGRLPSGCHQFLKEDCVKHSIANLNSNDKSEDRVRKYADTVNKPSYSLTCSPKASVEYAISGKSKLDGTDKTKVVPKPRVDLGSYHRQRNDGVSEVSKQSPEITREEFKMSEVKPQETKNGHTVVRNKREIAISGFKVAGNESCVVINGHRVTSGNSGIAKSGQRVASNESGIVRSGHRVASDESFISTNGHKVARNEPVVIRSGLNMVKNESDATRKSRELITQSVSRILPPSREHSFQDTTHTWKIDHLSMNKLGTGKKGPVSPFTIPPTCNREVNSSRSVSCHDMRGNPQPCEEQPPKQRSNYTFNHPSPTCLYPKRNIRDIHEHKTQVNETAVSQTMLPSKSPRRSDHESETPMSCKSFRGNPRDIDDLLVTREYSSEGFFIPESDEEDKVSMRYLKALDPVAERFSPELKRRNSLADYDFQERYHNMHWNSPCEHPMVKSRHNVLVNIADRTTVECDQRGQFRPQKEAEEEKMYLENKQQELQKGFQNYWSQRMKMRKEEFEKIRHEYRSSIGSAYDTAATGQRNSLARERSAVSPQIPKKAVRSGVDKTYRKTSPSENHKTHTKKTMPEEDTISRKNPQSSVVGQQPLRLSDVDVQIQRVDSSTIKRMRSKDRDLEQPRQKITEFPAKDLFRFAHKALLGSNFPKECTPPTELTMTKSKEVQENKSPSLLTRIINSFARSDRVRFSVGKGAEDRSGSSGPKESLIGTDGSGEGFVSVADMRGQVAKTSNYCANTGIHHRNKRRQSHSPQMSVTGLRDLRSDYNQNRNSNAKSHWQCGRKTNNNRCMFSNALNTPRQNTLAIILRKHLDSPVLCSLQSRKVSNIPKRPTRSLQYASVNKGKCTIGVNSCKLPKHLTNADPRATQSYPTSLVINGRAITLLTIILASSLSMHCEDSSVRLTFHPSLSASEQTFSPQETYYREAELAWPNTGPVFGVVCDGRHTKGHCS